MRTTRETLPGLMSLLALVLGVEGGAAVAGNVTARIAPAGDAIELETPTDIGVQRDVIPLYRNGEIQYLAPVSDRLSVRPRIRPIP